MDRRYLYSLGVVVLILVGLLGYFGYEYFITGNIGSYAYPDDSMIYQRENIEEGQVRLEKDFLKDRTISEYHGDIVCTPEDNGEADCDKVFKDAGGDLFILGFKSEPIAKDAYESLKVGDKLIVKGALDYSDSSDYPILRVDSYLVSK